MEVIKFRFIFETKEGKYIYVYLTLQQLMTNCYNQELHKLVAKYGEIKLVAKNQIDCIIHKKHKSENESKIKNTDKLIKRFLQRLEEDYGDSEMLGDVQYMFSAIENEMI